MMRGLTVRQPWAWAIVHGGKDVENRTRSLGPYRGPVAIHAGLAPFEQHNDASCLHRLLHGSETPTTIVYGAVIGVVDLVEVHLADEGWNDPDGDGPPCSPWAMDGHHHLVLANPRPLTHPIPWRGALGLWTVPAELEARIREQVTA